MSGYRRVFSVQLKEEAVHRLLQGESVGALSKELHVHVSNLYRWRESYCQEGTPGLRAQGAPRQLQRPVPTDPEEVGRQRIRELERKIGQQALDIDFLRRAFKRVKESRQQSGRAGAAASTGKSDA